MGPRPARPCTTLLTFVPELSLDWAILLQNLPFLGVVEEYLPITHDQSKTEKLDHQCYYY